MNKTTLFALPVCLIALILGFAHPAEAKTRVSVFFGGYSGYDYHHRHGPYWGPRYFAYPPYYPPPVVYAPPPPVVYTTPPVVYTQPQVTVIQPTYETALPANQASPTFTDSAGRLCREYDTSAIVGGHPQNVHGTACLQPDGAWRVVE